MVGVNGFSSTENCIIYRRLSYALNQDLEPCSGHFTEYKHTSMQSLAGCSPTPSLP